MSFRNVKAFPVYEEQLSMDTGNTASVGPQLYCSMDYGIKKCSLCTKNSVLRAGFRKLAALHGTYVAVLLFVSHMMHSEYVKKGREKSMQIILIKCGPQKYF